MYAVMGQAPTFGRVFEFLQLLEGVLVVDESYLRAICQLNDAIAKDCDAFAEESIRQLVRLQDFAGFQFDFAQFRLPV